AVAVWDGGLQFFGGLVAGALVLWRWLRAHPDLPGLLVADGIALALAAGLVAGRVGCFAVGEHLGERTSFPLGIRYLGGRTIEGPLAEGTAVHSTALYEALGVLVLIAVLAALRRRPQPAGTVLAAAALWYGVQRFLTDFLRAYDRRLLGLTTAQFVCLALVAFGAWMLLRLRTGDRGLVPRAVGS
ncbi:MAG: prolipoprotein diacylglyceryl transferase, partial [Acidimicrobiales bacterium]